jgi:hypothetical protein
VFEPAYLRINQPQPHCGSHVDADGNAKPEPRSHVDSSAHAPANLDVATARVRVFRASAGRQLVVPSVR